MSFQQPRLYSGDNERTEGAPASYLTNQQTSATIGKNIITQNNCTNGYTIAGGSGNTMRFVFPAQSNSIIKSGSAYLSFTLNVTKTAASNVWNFTQSGSAQSLFNRLIFTYEGKAIEDVNNYNVASNIDYLLGSSNGYVNYDSALLEKVDINQMPLVGGSAGTTATSLSIALPIRLDSLNAGQHFPLYFFGGQTIQLETFLNSIETSFCTVDPTPAASAITSYSISNPNIIYDRVELPSSLVDYNKAMVASGGKFVYSFVTKMVQPYADTLNLNVTIQTPAKSLRSVMWTCVPGSSSGSAIATYSAADKGAFQLGDGSNPAALTYSQLYINSELYNNINFNDISQQIAALKRYYARLSDSNHGFPYNLSRATFPTDFFCLVHNLQTTDNEGFNNTGAKVDGYVNLRLQKSTQNAGGQIFAILSYDKYLVVANDGILAVE